MAAIAGAISSGPFSKEMPSCSGLAEIVASAAATQGELDHRLRVALEPFRKAGLLGDLTVQFRKAQNGAVQIVSVTIQSRATVR